LTPGSTRQNHCAAVLVAAFGVSRPFISVERLDPSNRFVLGHFWPQSDICSAAMRPPSQVAVAANLRRARGRFDGKLTIHSIGAPTGLPAFARFLPSLGRDDMPHGWSLRAFSRPPRLGRVDRTCTRPHVANSNLGHSSAMTAPTPGGSTRLAHVGPPPRARERSQSTSTVRNRIPLFRHCRDQRQRIAGCSGLKSSKLADEFDEFSWSWFSGGRAVWCGGAALRGWP